MKTDDVLTAGEAAKILRVASRTVCKWFDRGKFPGGYRLPGSRDRRIPRASLEAFMANSAIPAPAGLATPEPALPLQTVEQMLAGTTLPVGVVRRLLVAAGLSAEEAGRLVEGALAKGAR